MDKVGQRVFSRDHSEAVSKASSSANNKNKTNNDKKS